MTPRRLLRLMLVGCLALPFASRPLAGWAQALPEPAGAVRDALTAFDAAMEGYGLTVPFDRVHQAARWLVALPL